MEEKIANIELPRDAAGRDKPIDMGPCTRPDRREEVEGDGH